MSSHRCSSLSLHPGIWRQRRVDPLCRSTENQWVSCAEGGLHSTVTILPQRTNNILEQFFRYLKRKDRKRSGNQSLTKTLTTMLAQTPLVKNLENPQYMKIILNGKATLAERFAEVNIDQVRKIFAEEKKDTKKYPKRMGKVFKITHLPKRLDMIQPKQAFAARRGSAKRVAGSPG